ncbi:MAG: hypothetical protein AB1457_09355 [Chloroflexota bacterium]
MDHIVYVDTKSREMEKLLSGKKTMIVRTASGRKLPYDRVKNGDRLFFTRNNGEGVILASALVKQVIQFGPVNRELSFEILNNHQSRLNLSESQVNRWGGKRYLVLVEINSLQKIAPFKFDRSAYNNMDDWLPVGSIETVKE